MIVSLKRLAVVAPHPDDETLGCGGTIARFANLGADVSVLIVSGGLPPLYSRKFFEITKCEAEAALKTLGTSQVEFLEIPATFVGDMPVAELNTKVGEFVHRYRPDVVLIPFPDRHIDHRAVFDAAVVGCRPNNPAAPRVVLAYETLSETHWNVPGIEPAFVPELFIDISAHIETKAAALRCYASQIGETSARSVEACTALARFRGSQNGCNYAEAFKVVRIVL